MDDGGICVMLNIAAAWEFVEKNKGKISWDLVALNPPFVPFVFYTLFGRADVFFHH